MISCLLLPSLVLAHGVTSEQIRQITALIQREPQNPQLYVRRGELYRLSGNAKAALEDYEQAEKLAPQLLEINFLRARQIREESDLADKSSLGQSFAQGLHKWFITRTATAADL